MTPTLDADMPMASVAEERLMEQRVLDRFAEFENATIRIPTGWNYRLNLATTFQVHVQGRELQELSATIQRLVDQSRLEKKLLSDSEKLNTVDYVQYRLV